MSLKDKIYYNFFRGVRLLNISKMYRIERGSREITPYKLVYFCGKREVDYLNASLISVYKNWDRIPEVMIVTDGTEPGLIQRKLIKWPVKLEIITWKDCAAYFEKTGNTQLASYAAKELWGKKFVSVLYCSHHFPSLYTDSDILWFRDPGHIDTSIKPLIKMSQDIGFFYSEQMLEALQEKKCLETTPFCAGLIYTNGEFSSFPKWKELCNYLYTLPDHRTEQTSFAIFNNYFNQDQYYSNKDILIRIDDTYSLKYTLKDNPDIKARHYVSVKHTTYWRDFLIMGFKNLFSKKKTDHN